MGDGSLRTRFFARQALVQADGAEQRSPDPVIQDGPSSKRGYDGEYARSSHSTGKPAAASVVSIARSISEKEVKGRLAVRPYADRRVPPAPFGRKDCLNPVGSTRRVLTPNNLLRNCGLTRSVSKGPFKSSTAKGALAFIRPRSPGTSAAPTQLPDGTPEP